MERPRIFSRFRLDLEDERLWHDAEEVPLGRKAFALLSVLTGRAGELVTKEALLDAVWPDTAVSEAVLTTAVRELRHSLGDSARSPRFIETVHGRGYRFIAPCDVDLDAPGAPAPTMPFVGRRREIATLDEWLRHARSGARRVGFVAGEAGLGKTALVDAFAARAHDEGFVVARGQCVQPYGSGEAYLPILEALGRLARSPRAAALERVLRSHAPSWVGHVLPAAGRRSRGAAGARHAPPPTPARMTRELADAVEALTASRPLLLVLEDLHWSDTATLTWLDYVARRSGAARLLVLGTFRPEEIAAHPGLATRLAGSRSHAGELSLEPLDRAAVESLVVARVGPNVDVDRLVEALHRRTEGHPLFLDALIEEFHRRGIARTDFDGDVAEVAQVLPASVRELIERQIDALPARDRKVLEAASAAGSEFPVAAVAAAAGLADETVEARCAAIEATSALLHAAGAERWPDGTLTGRYRFRHDLWREVVHLGLSPGRRAGMHQRIADRLDAGHRGRRDAIAGKLAVHFEEGRDARRALACREQAAENAQGRAATTEASEHLERAFESASALDDLDEREDAELRLTLALGRVRMALDGWAAPEVERLFERAHALSRKRGDVARELQALWGRISVRIVRGEVAATRASSEALLELAEETDDASAPAFRLLARMELAGTDLLSGRLEEAARGFDEALHLYEPDAHAAHVALFGVDLGVFATAWSSHALGLLGESGKSRERLARAIDLAERGGHPFSRAVALAYGAMLFQIEGDVAAALAHARAAARLCEEHGFPYYAAWARMLHGWARATADDAVEGAEEIRAGLAAFEATGSRRSIAYFRGLLADALHRAGDERAAERALRSAFDAHRASDERWMEPILESLAARAGAAPE